MCENAKAAVEAVAGGVKVEQRLEPGESRLGLENIRRYQVVGIVVRADGRAQREFGVDREANASRVAERIDFRVLLLHAVRCAGNTGRVDVMPIPLGEKVGRHADAEAEAGMLDGHAKGPHGNDSRSIAEKRVGVGRILERAACKDGVNIKIEIPAPKISETGGIRGESVEYVGRRADIDAAHTRGLGACRVPIELLCVQTAGTQGQTTE